MAAAGFTESMAKMVLEEEVSSTRFEDYCTELFRDVDEIEYVRTSRSWDLGRDGRGSSPINGLNSPLLCCSLRGDHQKKVKEDVERIAQFTRPKSLLVCCSTKVSEYESQRLEEIIREVLPSLESVRVNGLDQLSQLAIRYPRALNQFYSGELESIKAVLGYDETKEESIKLTGMRIALTTQLHDDAARRRRDLIRNLIQTSLSGGTYRNLEELSESVSESLYLSRVINESYFQSEINGLMTEGLIADVGNSYYLTDLGQLQLQERTEAGSEKLSVGQRAVRVAIADLTGYSIDSTEFGLIWNIFLDGIANMFLINGANIIEAISSIAEGRTASIKHQDLHDQIVKIGEKIASLGARSSKTEDDKKRSDGLGNRIKEISQAVVDLFTERETAAFQWIESICCTFVDICSLGLEPSAQAEIALRLNEIELLLDTDVVLSLLAEGEPNHNAVKTVAKGWKSIGGKLTVSQSVMEEAAYHAWISEREYTNIWRDLGEITDFDACHLIENVFVRTFRKVSKNNHEPRRWRNYIKAFRGSEKYNYSNMICILGEGFGIEFDSEEKCDDVLANFLSNKLVAERIGDARKEGHLISELSDKSSRDGKLIALLDKRRKRGKSDNQTACIVTSSNALRFGCNLVSDRLGAPAPVMSLASVAWLLSLLPGAHLSLSSLRGILFDSGLAKRLPPVELQALRILEASEEYEMHWSRRGTLVQAIREKVNKLAYQMGQSTEAVREAMMKEDEQSKEMFSEVVASSIDQIASSSSEKRLLQLAQENEKLRKELDRLRARRQ